MKSLVGIRPTGGLHLGHLMSVIKPALENDSDVLIADLHAPGCTTCEIARTVLTLQQFGIAERKLFVQSRIFDYRRFFRIAMLTPLGQLARMTQFKAATEMSEDDEREEQETLTKQRTTHMLLYPVMMTVDVYGYDVVFVGDDQMQHIEFARDMIAKYNKRWDKGCPLPEGKPVGGRIMDLRHPEQKMSSSEPEGCLFLTDTPSEIEAKISKVASLPPHIRNLNDIGAIFGAPPIDPDKMEASKMMLSIVIADAFAKATSAK